MSASILWDVSLHVDDEEQPYVHYEDVVLTVALDGRAALFRESGSEDPSLLLELSNCLVEAGAECVVVDGVSGPGRRRLTCRPAALRA